MGDDSAHPSGRRRGRPQRFPEDQHPIHSGRVGCDQRIAWLLTAARVLGADGELARRDGFIAALKAAGVSVDASRVSRWESGMQTLAPPVLATYECVLARPEGSLTAISDGLTRSFADSSVKRPPAREDPLSNTEIESLLDRTEQGAATGAHWLRLADELSRFDRFFLRDREWHRSASS